MEFTLYVCADSLKSGKKFLAFFRSGRFCCAIQSGFLSDEDRKALIALARDVVLALTGDAACRRLGAFGRRVELSAKPPKRFCSTTTRSAASASLFEQREAKAWLRCGRERQLSERQALKTI